MKEYNMIFSGIGGTGVITAARILAAAAVAEGHNVRLGEIHGMAQRLGAVSSALRIGEAVRGPMIPTGSADLLLSVEPIEALRRVDKVSPNGIILIGMLHVTPTAVLLDRAEYPSDEKILDELKKYATVVTIDAEQLAREAGNVMTLNIVLVGAAVGLGLIPIPRDAIIAAMKDILRTRYHEVNLKAFEKGEQAGVEALGKLNGR